MSGHSKWHNIAAKKGKTDAQRGKIYTKLGREILIAVRNGGPDPAANSKLRDVIAKCKANNMPNDNIERSFKKAEGDGDAANSEELTYEGDGPNGVAILIEVATDNKNRSAADIRCIFDRSGGNMGQTGSVGSMFDKKGVIIIENTEAIDEQELMMQVIDAGAEDFTSDEEYFEIITAPQDFANVREVLENENYELVEAEIKMVPNMKKDLSEEEEEKVNKFLDKLDDNDYVQNVWHNANI